MGSPVLEGLAGWWKDERAPLRDMIAERKREKLNLHLSQSSAVGLLLFLGNEGGNPSVYHSGNGSHAARGRKDKGGECAMLDFSHPFIICSLLLVLSIALCKWGVAVTLCHWVENPDIEKCMLSIASPVALCDYIKTGSIFSVCSFVLQLFLGQ